MHYFTNFKNFANAKIDLFKPLTILIGKNGSGKTNLIEAIQVFTHLAQGTPLHKFSDIGKGGDCQIRGGLGNCVDFSVDNFELRIEGGSVSFSGNSYAVDYNIKIGRTAERDSILLAERLLLTDVQETKSTPVQYTFFDTQQKTEQDTLEVKYETFTGELHDFLLSPQQSVLSRYEEVIAHSSAKNAEIKQAPQSVRNILDYLKKAYIFDPNPKAMREYERFSGHAKLSRDGRNLSTVLYALKKNEQMEKLNRITGIIGQLPEEPFSGIDFIETSANDVMLGFYIGNKEEDRQFFDARMLSDGTLRTLAVLTALETVPPNSRIVIEEFDNGLHPSRADLLVKHLYETAERRKLNIVVTTHNPAFMNALDEEQMNSVVLCHRDPENGHSKLTHLMTMPDFDLMIMGDNLGDLVTEEAVEKSFSPEFQEKRAEIFRQWATQHHS